MKQTHGEKTKQKILKAGVKLWPDVSLANVARECDLTHAAVLYHFPSMTLKMSIARFAVDQGNSNVIVQLIGAGHTAIADLCETDRQRHFDAI